MNFRSKLADDFSAEIYTPFEDIKAEIDRRWKDEELHKKVEDFFRENQIKELQSEPRAVLSRTLATPNAELFYFLDLAEDLELNPLILEYPDKFVAKNPDKYHLTRLFFYRKAKDLKSFPVSTSRIVDFNKHEGRKFSDIPTLWGENIVDFHHNLLYQAVPSLDGKVANFSNWFDSTRFSSKFYYLHFLSLFIRNGVLFDNFLIEDKEEGSFIQNKFLPSFREAQRIFGVKPLIYPLIPFDGEKHPHWLSYPEHMRIRLDEWMSNRSNI